MDNDNITNIENENQENEFEDSVEQNESSTEDNENTTEEFSESDYLHKISDLEQALAQAKEQTLRTMAELENVKKRSQKDLENAHKYANDNFVRELLPVLDSFDAAKKGFTPEQKESLDGVEMIEQNLIQILNKFQVEIINPGTGEDFNPESHQAMSTQPHDELPSNKVIMVFQKGFSMKGRLIRPAIVVVSQ